MNDAELWTAAEVAAYLRVPSATVYKLARTGQLPAFRVGKHWRFRATAIRQWIVNREPSLSSDRALTTRSPDDPNPH